MAFPVSLVKTSEIAWDSLYVGKITCYPLEKRDYKPYAQASICYHLPKRELAVRMWAFETHPVCTPDAQGKDILRDSTLALRLQLGDVPFFAAFNAAGRCYSTKEPGMVKVFEGEDLQGVYWGVLFTIPIERLMGEGMPDWKPGTKMKGNFYKLCFGDRPHQGSYREMVHVGSTVLETEEMEDFILVDY